MRKTISLLLCLAAALLVLPGAAFAGDDDDRPRKPKPPAEVQLLGLNDFHGNLQPPTGSSGLIAGTTAGGAEFLAEHIRRIEAENRKNSLLVSAAT